MNSNMTARIVCVSVLIFLSVFFLSAGSAVARSNFSSFGCLSTLQSVPVMLGSTQKAAPRVTSSSQTTISCQDSYSYSNDIFVKSFEGTKLWYEQNLPSTWQYDESQSGSDAVFKICLDNSTLAVGAFGVGANPHTRLITLRKDSDECLPTSGPTAESVPKSIPSPDTISVSSKYCGSGEFAKLVPVREMAAAISEDLNRLVNSGSVNSFQAVLDSTTAITVHDYLSVLSECTYDCNCEDVKMSEPGYSNIYEKLSWYNSAAQGLNTGYGYSLPEIQLNEEGQPIVSKAKSFLKPSANKTTKRKSNGDLSQRPPEIDDDALQEARSKIAVQTSSSSTALTVEGDVEFQNFGGGEWLSLSQDQTIPGGATIVTGIDSKLLISLPDNGGIVEVLPLTQITLTQEGVAEAVKEGTATRNIDLNAGEVEVIIDADSTRSPNDPASFQISTPNSVAGVRGTHFWVSYDTDSKASVIGVYSGEVTVLNKDTGKLASVSSSEGQVSVVEISNGPTSWKRTLVVVTVLVVVLSGTVLVLKKRLS